MPSLPLHGSGYLKGAGLFSTTKQDVISSHSLFARYRPDPITLNPFASIGHTGTSKVKVKVRDICLNISFLT